MGKTLQLGTLAATAALGLVAGCMGIKSAGRPALAENYGTLPDGRSAKIFTLANANGLKARVTEYGATLVSLEAPDRAGKMAEQRPGDARIEQDGIAAGLRLGRVELRDGALAGKASDLLGRVEVGKVPGTMPGTVALHRAAFARDDRDAGAVAGRSVGAAEAGRGGEGEGARRASG